MGPRNTLPNQLGSQRVYTAPPAAFAGWPTEIKSPETARLRRVSLEDQADISGLRFSVPATFSQLKTDITNQHFISALIKFDVDNPSNLDRLALANLRENKRARNDLAALHAARSCAYGGRGLGEKKWFTDKPGISKRLKTQAQRRQFRMGLVANIAFYNRLNMLDIRTLLESGTNSDLALVNATTPMTLTQFQYMVQRLSPIDLLRLFSPDKAARVSELLSEISAIADYEQTLCNHLAACEALEPSHAVLSKLLRSGANFQTALTYQPHQLATQAMSLLCSSPDVDGTLALKRKGV